MMLNDKKGSIESPANKKWQYIKKNGIMILLVLATGIMFFSTDAKSYVLRQLIATGLFNASIGDKEKVTAPVASTDFDFADEKGNIRNTSSLRGKVVFINFWASWCPPCRAEFPAIEKFYTTFKDNPAVFFLSMNEDNELAIGKAYLDKEKFSMPIYVSTGNLPEAIYSGSLPTTIVLDKAGKIRYHHAGIANYASPKFIKQIEELIQQ